MLARGRGCGGAGVVSSRVWGRGWRCAAGGGDLTRPWLAGSPAAAATHAAPPPRSAVYHQVRRLPCPSATRARFTGISTTLNACLLVGLSKITSPNFQVSPGALRS